MPTLRLMVCVLALASCRRAPTVDPRFEPAKAAFQKKLALLPAIAKTLHATAPLKHDTLTAAAKGRFAILSSPQLSSVGGCFEGPASGVCDDLWWALSSCQRIADQKAETVAELDVNALERCSTLARLAVVRQTSFHRPHADHASRTYEGGHLAADVFVFDFDTGVLLGGLRTDARTPESLDKVTATTNVDRWLHEILGRLTYDQVLKRIDG
ncbi:MAG: hypothetical protein Q8N26_35070 [Myxococcales bacterium]|nr:hypothetical protein [Myxococcales bacterium]